MRAEIRTLLEKHLDELPRASRTVFVLREVEEMNIDEISECLDIPEATVRTRVSRATTLFRTSLEREIHRLLPRAFCFCGSRCERAVDAVLSRISKYAITPDQKE